MTKTITKIQNKRFSAAWCIVGLLLCALPAAAQTATPSPSPFLLAQTNAGVIINNACIWTYVAGTTTAATTYTDQTAGVANTNPIRSSSDGRFSAWLIPGNSYKFVYETACTPPAHGSVLKTVDNIPAVPTSGASVDYQGTAGENLTLGQAAYLSDGSGGKTAGQWYRADSANAYSSTTPTIGIVTASASSAGTVTVRGTGRLTGLSALSVGSDYYVGTAGALTSTAPTNSRFVGRADTTTSLDIAANPPPASAAPTTQTTTVTGTQNNFSVTASRRLLLYANNASAVTFTGFTAGQDGDSIDVVSIGAGTVSTTSQDAGSTAANRIITATGLTSSVTASRFVYDAANARWRQVAEVPNRLVLLKSNSGTTTNAAAENVDTIAISGLTAKDVLHVIVTWEAVTQQTASVFLYSSTDSKNLDEVDGGVAIAAGVTRVYEGTLMQAQSSSTLITARNIGASITTDDTRTTGASIGYRNTVTTAWTGSWTLALRQGGVTAGGTGKWSWSVYILRGQ